MGAGHPAGKSGRGLGVVYHVMVPSRLSGGWTSPLANHVRGRLADGRIWIRKGEIRRISRIRDTDGSNCATGLAGTHRAFCP